ncbi:MAG: enoyl-CoA hydratase/isomerase family protein, partial [Candidatus Korarchaeota archaeon]|nr:enoyl-CoA hydratase/isomerase family protein [Candidatus Korarchaeota archaeon]
LLHERFKREELEQAIEELMKTIASCEGKEGHKAFMEKRTPKWVSS